MTPRKFVKPAAAVAAFAAIILAGMLSSSPRVKATDDVDDDRNESRILRGFEIAPVPLNLEGKNRALVGLGSYIVNAHVPAMSATAPALLPLKSILWPDGGHQSGNLLWWWQGFWCNSTRRCAHHLPQPDTR